MLRFGTGMGLLMWHAAGRPPVLQRRRACAPSAHAATTRCSGDAGQNLFRLSWSGWTTWRLTTPRPSIYFSEYIELSRNGKQLFGFLSSFLHRRPTVTRIEVATHDGPHRVDAGDGLMPKSSIIRRLKERPRRRAYPAHVCVAIRFTVCPRFAVKGGASLCRSRARRTVRAQKSAARTHSMRRTSRCRRSHHRRHHAIPQKTGHRHMDRAEHISIEQTSAIPADELDRCDFSFDIAWELNAPYQDLLDLRALPARRKHYGFDPAGWADEATGKTALFRATAGGRLRFWPERAGPDRGRAFRRLHNRRSGPGCRRRWYRAERCE